MADRLLERGDPTLEFVSPGSIVRHVESIAEEAEPKNTEKQ